MDWFTASWPFALIVLMTLLFVGVTVGADWLTGR